MLARRSGKEKSSLIPLNYARGRPRRIGIALVVGATTLLGVGAYLFAGRWEQAASPGPVHSAHAAWEDNCAACHLPFQPTASGNGLHGLLDTGGAADALCQKCHQGPPHHAGRERPEDAASCASCHLDHRGRHARLAAVPDRTCTHCHADLAAHVIDGQPLFAGKITRFDRDHPQFRIGHGADRAELGRARDPGRLRFNHKLHLTLAHPATGAALGCGSCHQLDATTGRSEGANFQPVTFDQHCKACHPLTFDPRLKTSVPHHLQPAEVSDFLWGAYATAQFPVDGKKAPGRPLPGPNLSREEIAVRKKQIGDQVRQAEGLLWLTDLKRARQYVFEGKAACGLCHEYERKDGRPVRVLPVEVPRVWYPHARFSHRAHRGVDCLSCHDGAKESTTHTDVLLPGVANCVQCHAPAKGSGEAKQGGVRHDCVTCHAYHHGDRPMAGRGADARGAKRLDIGAFLRGK